MLEEKDYSLKKIGNRIRLRCKDGKWAYDGINYVYDYAEPFDGEFAAVSINGKWGFINLKLEIAIPIIYEKVERFNIDRGSPFPVKKDGKWFYLSHDNVSVYPFLFDNAQSFCNGKASVIYKGHLYAIDRTGNLQFHSDFFEENKEDFLLYGYVVFNINNNHYLIDKNLCCTTLLPNNTYFYNKFFRGRVFVYNKEKKYCINGKGENVHIYPMLINRNYHNGLSVFKYDIEYNTKYGYLNNKNEIEIIPIFDKAQNFSEGLALVETEDSEEGKTVKYINRAGDKVLDVSLYDEAKSFSEGVACVKKNDKWGYINKTGDCVINFEYDDAESFSEGVACVKKNDKWGYIDKSNKIVIDFKYDIAFSFSESFAVVGENEDRFFIKNIYISKEILLYLKFDFNLDIYWDYVEKDKLKDLENRYKILNEIESFNCYFGKFQNARSFNDGCAVFQLKNRWGVINNSGAIIVPPIFDDISDFRNGYAFVFYSCDTKNYNIGLIDTKGLLIVPPVFDFVDIFYCGLCRVKIKNKWGFLDLEGNIAIDFIYSFAFSFYNGFALVKSNSEWKYIDILGRECYPRGYEDANDLAKSIGITYFESWDLDSELDNIYIYHCIKDD